MATSKTETFKKLPGVLSFQRAYNVSDAEMFNVMPDGSRTPVEVVRHGIRGTQNVSSAAGATAKGGERAVSNIQVTETAKLHPNAVAMEVQFSNRFFDLSRSLSACASDDRVLMKGMRTSIDGFIERSKTGVNLLKNVIREHAGQMRIAIQLDQRLSRRLVRLVSNL